VPRDEEAAASWYERCADAGNAACQYRLGAAYMEGRGVIQSDEAAFVYVALAAAGFVDAFFPLGALHLAGRGAPGTLRRA